MKRGGCVKYRINTDLFLSTTNEYELRTHTLRARCGTFTLLHGLGNEYKLLTHTFQARCGTFLSSAICCFSSNSTRTLVSRNLQNQTFPQKKYILSLLTSFIYLNFRAARSVCASLSSPAADTHSFALAAIRQNAMNFLIFLNA